MIRITRQDFDKLVTIVKKEGMDGASLAFWVSSTGANLGIRTLDRSNKEITITISDTEYPFMPTITRTETF